MHTLMDNLKKEEYRLDLEQEYTHGDYEKMKLIFEKKLTFTKNI